MLKNSVLFTLSLSFCFIVPLFTSPIIYIPKLHIRHFYFTSSVVFRLLIFSFCLLFGVLRLQFDVCQRFFYWTLSSQLNLHVSHRCWLFKSLTSVIPSTQSSMLLKAHPLFFLNKSDVSSPLRFEIESSILFL